MDREAIAAIYRELEPFIRQVGQSDLIDPDFYLIALKAALVKTYDFNVFVSGLESTSHSFYHTATLRGMCEDIIIFKGFQSVPPADKSRLVAHIQMKDAYESMKKQRVFFGKYREEQPVLCPSNVDQLLANETASAVALLNQYGFQHIKGRLNVRQVAEKAGLLELYDFFYSATSKWVHFSPHVLLRMGWGPERTPDTTFIFSTHHFTEYYAAFNCIYGTYLFVLFCDTFQSLLSLDPRLSGGVEALREKLEETIRWPEVITFEEMNQELPSPILLAALKVMTDEKRKSSSDK